MNTALHYIHLRNAISPGPDNVDLQADIPRADLKIGRIKLALIMTGIIGGLIFAAMLIINVLQGEKISIKG